LSEFNKLERTFARALERSPRLRTAIKEFYKRLVYLRFNEPGFQYELNPNASLLPPQEWAGLPQAKGEWFFGYYDKSPWSSDMNRALFHRPNGGKVAIIVLQRESKNASVIGDSDTWNWQQGSMAQWLPGSTEPRVVFNTTENGILGCRLVALEKGFNRFIPWPIQTLHPAGHEALTLNYRRLDRLRPDYGYSMKVKNFSFRQGLDEDGIWLVDLDEGTGTLVIPISDLACHKPIPEMKGAQHKVNHLIYSPSGAKFVFLYRFIGDKGKFSRLCVAKPDGSNLRLLMDARMVSHYHWRDNNHLLVWGRTREKGDHYYLVDVNNGTTEIIGEGVLDRYGDGHCSFSPDGRWIVTDTYPDRARQQRLLLFDILKEKYVTVGRFFSPWEFLDSRRCDLHPRWSPDGQWISIDSAHEGIRRTYFVDVSKIVRGD